MIDFVRKYYEYLLILIIVIAIAYCLLFSYRKWQIDKYSKKNYVKVNSADTILAPHLILEQFDNLILFKNKNDVQNKLFYSNPEAKAYYLEKMIISILYNEDMEQWIAKVKFNENKYESIFIKNNYEILPDTIYANGYFIFPLRYDSLGYLQTRGENQGIPILIKSYRYKR
jgi:hypothetical protein